MKKRYILIFVILGIVGFLFYKIAIQPVQSNQEEIDNVSRILDESVEKIDSYKMLRITMGGREVVKEVQKYKDGDFYVIESVSPDGSFAKTGCIDDVIVIYNDGDTYYHDPEAKCSEELNLLDINIAGLVLDEYDDDLVSFDYYDDHTIIIFDVKSFEEGAFAKLHPQLVDAIVTKFEIDVHQDGTVTFNANFEKEGETIELVVVIENKIVIERVE